MHPVKYQGVVCSMKDVFGYIERADIVKEISFPFTEFKDSSKPLQLGDDVEFIIQTRNVSFFFFCIIILFVDLVFVLSRIIYINILKCSVSFILYIVSINQYSI